MTAQELLDGINSIANQLITFRVSAHSDRPTCDLGVVVLLELANLVREVKADELGDDGERETVIVTADEVGDVAEILDPGQPTDAPTG
jgi:hypothetical protein